MFDFEVTFRHAVSETKASDLDLSWMELDADEILGFGPRVPIGASVSHERCPRCQHRHEQLELRSSDNQKREHVDADYRADAVDFRGRGGKC